MDSPILEQLYADVTEAIFRAEHAEAAGDAAETARAYFKVSLLEEEIANQLPDDDLVEGAVARRGVITAALGAHDYARALEYADRYLARAPTSLRVKLLELRAEAQDALSAGAVRVIPWAKFRIHDEAA